MSRESTQPAPPEPHEQEQASVPSLPMEADPSGFIERAPALASLLPDEALALALARGDTFAVRAALTARLARESAGPTRDTLREILADRTLFVVSERPPRLGGFLGIGVDLAGLPPPEKQQTPFIATRAVCLLGVPIWPLGEHLVRRGRDGKLEVLGRVAGSSGSRVARWVALLTLGGLVLTATSLMLAPFFTHEVQLVNGLSRPVEVRLEDQLITLRPGEIATRQIFSLGALLHVEARWPGEEKPIEVASFGTGERAVYNVLGVASLQVTHPKSRYDSRILKGSTGTLEPEEQMRLRGGWERTVRDYANAEMWREAAELAKAVFHADPTDLQAAEEAARILARTEPKEALAFAHELYGTFPGEPATSQLAQDLFIALGQRSEAFRLYELMSQQAPDSVHRALLAARVAPPEQWRQAYASVLERFPEAPAAKRAMARVRLADGFPKEALKLLDEALVSAPESLEDLELRVRTLASLRQLREASGIVRQFAGDPRNRSWELAILAGRLARMAGPSRTQYVTRDLLPPELAASPEHMVAFALLTGESTVTDRELRAVIQTAAYETLVLTRTIFDDLDKAVSKATSPLSGVSRRLDPETAALLALELSRRGEAQAAERVFGSRVALLAAKEPLVAYVHSGEVRPEFPQLPPGLLAAAYLVRARAVSQNRFVEQAYARWTDALGGMARRALDSDYEEPDPRTDPPDWPEPRSRRHRWQIIQIIRGSDSQLPPGSPPVPRPEGDRIPRPWPAP